MADFEGSVNVEGFDDTEETVETTSENINNQENESEEENQETENTSETDDTQGEDETKYTDKGTKLDPNPKSALHQELANAKREAEEYRKFMSDPKQVKKYLSELEEELGNATGESKSEIQDRAEDENLITDPSKIVTPEDFQSYVKFLTKDIQNVKNELLKERDGIREEARERAVNERLINDIDELQKTYSVLNPNSPDFDKDLETEIANQFDELDKDSKSGKYMGRVSMKAIAERAIRIRKLGEVTGGKKANEIVVDKRFGAVKSGSNKSSSSDETKMSAAQLIAFRMQKARGN